MKRENVKEIWDWAGFIFSTPAIWLLVHQESLGDGMSPLICIAVLYIFGLIGLVIKFHYGLKWLSSVFISSVLDIAYATGFLFKYLS